MAYRIKKSDIWMFWFAVFMIRPYYVTLNTQINMVWAYCTLVCAAITSFIVLNNKKLRCEAEIIGFFSAIYLLATIIQNPSSIMSAVSTIAQIVLPYNMGVLLISDAKRPSLEKNISLVCTLYIYVDAFCTFLHVSEKVLHQPMELTFLGYDNYAAFNILAMMVVKFAIDERNHEGKLTNEDYLCYLVCCAGKLVTGSVAACISLFAFAFIKFVSLHYKRLIRCLRPMKIVVFLVGLFVVVYYFKVYRLFSAILVALGKGSDLNSRTIIWSKVLHHIADIPIIGNGYYSVEDFRIFFEFPYGFNVTHPHNIILCILVDTGLLGLIVYCRWLTKVSVNKKVLSFGWYRTLLIGLVCYLLQGFWDFYTLLSGFYILLAVTISYGKLLNRVSTECSQKE